MPYLLHEDPMALLAPTNHPLIKCEKTQLNNSFESILAEDVSYFNRSRRESISRSQSYVQSVCNAFYVFLYIYIYIYIVYVYIYTVFPQISASPSISAALLNPCLLE